MKGLVKSVKNVLPTILYYENEILFEDTASL